MYDWQNVLKASKVQLLILQKNGSGEHYACVYYYLYIPRLLLVMHLGVRFVACKSLFCM